VSSDFGEIMRLGYIIDEVEAAAVADAGRSRRNTQM
jgi:hypothetical protein